MNEDQHRLTMLNAVRAMQIMPFFYAAWSRGTKLRPFISELTGLSQTRLAKPSQNMRAKKLEDVLAHAKDKISEKLRTRDYSESDIAERIAGQNQLEESGGRAWASYWYSENFVYKPALKKSIELGRQLDLFLVDAERALAIEDINEFNRVCAMFVDLWRLPDHVSDKCSIASPEAIRGAVKWEDSLKFFDGILLAAFFDQFAQFDAVYGALVLEPLRPRSLIALIAPTRKGAAGVNMPARRLIVLFYTILYRKRHKKWPENKPRRSDIAQKLIRWSAQDLANLFDGTKKLRLIDIEAMWEDMLEGFNIIDECPGPFALARIAIFLQKQLVEIGPDQKIRSFILLDDDFHSLWAWRRSQILDAPQGTIDWPLWLND